MSGYCSVRRLRLTLVSATCHDVLIDSLLSGGDQVSVYVVQASWVGLAACKHVDGVLASSRQTDIKQSSTSCDRLTHAVCQAGAVAAVTVQLTDEFNVVRVCLERYLDAAVGRRQQTVLVTYRPHSKLIGHGTLANNACHTTQPKYDQNIYKAPGLI